MRKLNNWINKNSKIVNSFIPEHKGYVEVFGSDRYLLFIKQPANWEILNDYNNNLVVFWRKVKNTPENYITEGIKPAYKRLQNVTIENKPMEDIFKIYDSKGTFFFIDKPNGNNNALMEHLKKTKGKWLMLAEKEAGEIFKNFNVYNNFKDELIITNYKI